MVRLAALMGAGSFAVHQARYVLGYRSEASDALAAQGHAYLTPVVPLLAGALLLCLAALVRRVASGAGAPAPRFRLIWLGTTLALLGVYAAQELIEGALVSHHPVGLAALTGHGGWVVVPLALVIGLVIGLLMRGASAAAQLTVRGRPWRAAPRVLPPSFAVGVPPLAPRRAGAALAHGPRGPPLLAA